VASGFIGNVGVNIGKALRRINWYHLVDDHGKRGKYSEFNAKIQGLSSCLFLALRKWQENMSVLFFLQADHP
jgi:hypothetical protein